MAVPRPVADGAGPPPAPQHALDHALDHGTESGPESGPDHGPSWRELPDPLGRTTPSSVVVVSPTVDDPVVRALSDVVGGPVGRHAGRRRPVAGPGLFPTAASVLVLVSTAVLALAALLRGHCRATGWASPDQFTHACYSDIPTTAASSGLTTGTLPFLEPVAGQYLAQPLGTGFTLWGLAALSPDGGDRARWVFDLAVLLLVLATAVVVVCVALLSRHRPWDAALVAASPVLLTSALISLDLLAVALAMLGLLAFSRRHPALAGALLALAVLVRPLALVVLVALALVGARTGHRSTVATTWVAAVVAWVGLNLPVAVLYPDGWGAYWGSLWNAPAGYGSVWLLPQLLAAELGGQASVPRAPAWTALVGLVLVAGAAVVLAAAPATTRRLWVPRSWRATAAVVVAVVVLPALVVRFAPAGLQWVATHQLGPAAMRWVTAAGLVVVVTAVALFTLGTRRRPRLPAVVLVLLVGSLLVLPSIPVQAAVWVLPFAALAVPRWRDLLVWGAVESVYATCTWLYLYGLSVPERGLPAWLYVVVTVARAGMLVYLAARAVQLSRRPELDPVRAHDLETDDPAAGEMEDAPDALVVTFA